MGHLLVSPGFKQFFHGAGPARGYLFALPPQAVLPVIYSLEQMDLKSKTHKMMNPGFQALALSLQLAEYESLYPAFLLSRSSTTRITSS